MLLKHIDLPGQTLAALTANDECPGPPIVFVHGITATVDVWLPTMPEAVRNQRRWISLSLPGHHPARIDRATFGRWQDVTPATWAEWHDSALQQLVGDQPVDLVGWSTGGFTGLALAAFYPHRVRRVFSICGFACGSHLPLIRQLQPLNRSRWARGAIPWGLSRIGRRRWLFNWMVQTGVRDRAAFQSSPFREQTMDGWFTAFAQHDHVVMAGLLNKITQFNLSDQLSQIRCPVLLAAGGEDPYIDSAHPGWIAERLQDAELVVWPRAGHMFFCERTEDYQKLLLRWSEDH